MSWIGHFCHECHVKFIKARDYIIHHSENHLSSNQSKDSIEWEESLARQKFKEQE